MKTRRQMTNQDAQRARVRHRRRRRGPADVMRHGNRSQSGVRIRSHQAWAEYVVSRKLAAMEAERRDSVVAGWQWRAAEKAKA